MAYDRTIRFPKIITQTSVKVGPGTYEISDVTCPDRHLAEYTPFLCGTERKTVQVPKEIARFPGPTSYTLRTRRHIPGGVSIDFRDIRFKEEIPQTPSPICNLTETLVKEKIRSHPGTWRGPPGKLWLTRPPPSIIPTATSIPDKDYTGYDINEYGVFVKNPPIKRKPTYFYNVHRGETNATTLLYKGNFWSRMTGRTEHQPFVTPGPGHYEHETKKTANQIHDEKIREIKRMTSWQPRSLDILYRVKMRENLPAPNAYKIKSVFDKYSKSRCKCDTYVVEPAPFGQTAKRFVDADSDIPGPGTYNPIIPIKCTSSIFPAPFGSYATRFKKDPTHFGPGPSDYDLNAGNLAFESERRYKYTYAKKMKPQVYLDAISYCEEEEEYYTPCSPKRIEETKTLVHHVAFKSKVERFPEVQKRGPDAGIYETLKAFKRNRDKCEFPALHVPFGTRDTRSSKIWLDTKKTPDPTSYHLSKDILKNAKGGVIDRSTKIEKYTPLLGPAYYTLPPYLSSPLLKKSFNVTLGKPEIVKKLEKEEEKERKKVRCPCKRKKLRWFERKI